MPTFTKTEVPYFGNFAQEGMKTDANRLITKTSRPIIIVGVLKPESLSSKRGANNYYSYSSAAD